jgi:tRNA (guanine-N7-)-methyltransferase
MGQQKLKRFAEFVTFPNCFDFPYHLKGKWKTEVFKNNKPLVLELACGKGEYTVNLAQQDPETNFVGIDIKSNRMWKGARISQELGLTNTGFVRMSIQKINMFFEPGEVDEIWITFPDPFPKERHEKNRLTHPEFLTLYKNIIKPNGIINFKTDDDGLFDYTLEALENVNITPVEIIRDVHNEPHNYDNLRNITTHYEKLFSAKGRKIKYCKFKLDTLNYSPKLEVFENNILEINQNK